MKYGCSGSFRQAFLNFQYLILRVTVQEYPEKETYANLIALPILPGANFDQLVKLCETVCEQVKQVTLLGKGLESLLIIFKLRQNQKIGSRTPI